MNEVASRIIEKLDLKLHVEGGYFREIYKNPNDVYHPDGKKKRPLCSHIYYLLKNDDISSLHCLGSDEIWHYYQGNSPVRIYILDEVGSIQSFLLTNDLQYDGSFHVLIPANSWFCAELIGESAYALMGCTVSPGFSYQDFNLADKVDLNKKFPQHKEFITKFTHD